LAILAKQLVENTNYINKDIEYLKNVNIIEYDIKSAGFTTLKYKKLLPSDEIAKLEKMSNLDRNIYIGKQIKKFPHIGEELINTLIDVRKDFVVLNNIMEDDILSIKKDALFLIKKEPTSLTVRKVFEFREKKKYTSYCYINNKEFFYSSYDDTLDVKGIGKEYQEKQEDYLLQDIKKILSMSEKLMPDQLFLYLQRYRSKYLNRQLDKNVYRNLDTGEFVIRGEYKMDELPDELIDEVDIVHNYMNYLIPLFRALI
jgi:hypothetical protein